MSPTALCVYCREREAAGRYRPFCSERCKLADLGHWLNGDYRIAAEPLDVVQDTASVDELDDTGR